MQFDGLAFESARVGLNLHILFKQTVNGFLGFVQLNRYRGLSVQLELLFYGFGQIPAEEHKGVTAVAFGVKESPGFLRCVGQSVVLKVAENVLKV